MENFDFKKYLAKGGINEAMSHTGGVSFGDGGYSVNPEEELKQIFIDNGGFPFAFSQNQTDSIFSDFVEKHNLERDEFVAMKENVDEWYWNEYVVKDLDYETEEDMDHQDALDRASATGSTEFMNEGDMDGKWMGGDEHLERMEGLADARNLKLAKDMLRLLVTDWNQEMFDKRDAKKFFNKFIDQI